ncbi:MULTISPECIES: STAS domain-containing protein [unclassified Streptomyces]|uniref:STAS domain-containing protein n=1 Tax=unclassified Streptomyces TaxID=2593676 RepID=UPI0036C51255
MRDFTVTAAHHPGGTVVTVCGEMDLDTSPQVEEIAAALPVGNETVCLDLSAVPFLDSMGLNTLLRLRRRVRTHGGRLLLAGLQTQPSDVLHLTETYVLFDTGVSPAPR